MLVRLLCLDERAGTDELVQVAQGREQRTHARERQSVRPVGEGALRRFVDFHEDGVHAAGDSRARERFDVLRLPARCTPQSARQLQAVRHVEDYGDAETAHDRKRAHVNDEVVVAEAEAALCEQEFLAPGGACLLDDVARVPGREELPLLDVDGAARLAGGDNQVRLTAEEGRDLQNVRDARGLFDLRNVVNVGGHGQARLLFDCAQRFESFADAWAAVGGVRRAVGLVVGSLEDVVESRVARPLPALARNHQRVLARLDDARAGDDRQTPIAERRAADAERFYLCLSQFFAHLSRRLSLYRPQFLKRPPSRSGCCLLPFVGLLRVGVRVCVLPAVAFPRGAAAQVAQSVLDLITVFVARRLLEEGLELFDGLVGVVGLLVEKAEVVVRVCEVAAALVYCLAQRRLRAFVVLLLRERDAEPVESFGVAPAILLDGLAEGVGRLREVALLVEDCADLVEGVGGVAALTIDCVAVGRERLVALALLLEREAEVVLRHGVVAAALCDGRAELVRRRAELPFEHERAAQAVVRGGKVGLEFDGAAQVAYGGVVATYGEEVGAVLVELGGGLRLLKRVAARLLRAVGRESAAQRVVLLVGAHVRRPSVGIACGRAQE